MNRTELVEKLMEYQQEYGLVDTLHGVFGKNIRVNVSFSLETCSENIDVLSLSVRSHNALRRANISTIGRLIDKINEGNLKSLRNLGAKSYCEIQTKIVVYGFELLSDAKKKEFFQTLVDYNV